ncbi:hypothetical protein OPQ81_004627 [Rhizoctonia solani]|nr:hypothetical protein OPQ81_004627 [Rhizoctonia solani]
MSKNLEIRLFQEWQSTQPIERQARMEAFNSYPGATSAHERGTGRVDRCPGLCGVVAPYTLEITAREFKVCIHAKLAHPMAVEFFFHGQGFKCLAAAHIDSWSRTRRLTSKSGLSPYLHPMRGSI